MQSSVIVIVLSWLVLQTSADNMFNVSFLFSFSEVKEYFKRGMYECALDYLKDIQEIHRYVQKASARQQECRTKASSTDKTFPKTNIAPLDEYIEKMRQEEEEAKSLRQTRAARTL
ncbi:hypothetical protein Y032_0004g2227 [Ancylostoma ceylanicum]|uniref:Uncharacterized protein n=1 Tax=Ancylostoma ceylanicum TaxID=53326 RepID=A0A016VVI5_9BILA|nr:hypothetical protein Y032_0004g2227 [Ancylostoma ceylanicum]